MGRDLERVLPTRDPLATAVLMFLIGLVMVIMQSGAISILVVFAGVLLLVYASSEISLGIRSKDGGKDLLLGIFMAIIGLLLIVATGFMQGLLTIIVGVFLIVLGIMSAVSNSDTGKRRRGVGFAVAALMVVIGVLMVLWPGVTTGIAVLLIGLVMVVVSALSIYSYLR